MKFPIVLPAKAEMSVWLLGGAVIALLFFHGVGLTVPANIARAEIAQARIDERAILCKEAALAHLAELGLTDPLNATGMPARENRDALATQFLIASGDKAKDHLVRDACSAKLGA